MEARVGIVVIGRNEGERLVRCLESLGSSIPHCIYVDSGSRDDSVRTARAMGARVVELDMARPFTAARARNEGFRALLAHVPGVEFVQFVDGDCQVAPGWIPAALRWLDDHPEAAVVCGRRRERHPDRSVYNMLCDREWDTPIGDTKACGGDAMMRVAALQTVDGFRDDLIAGEEPELCVRLRRAGWRIRRLDAEMTLHDAAMTRFSQWWQRCARAGYAYAQAVALHGGPPERHGVRESRSIWLWAVGIPAAGLLLLAGWAGWGMALLLAYPLQIVRLAARERGPARERWQRAAFLVLGKFPEWVGQVRYLARRLAGGPQKLIEYK